MSKTLLILIIIADNLRLLKYSGHFSLSFLTQTENVSTCLQTLTVLFKKNNNKKKKIQIKDELCTKTVNVVGRNNH